MAARIRRVSSKKEFEQVIDDFVTTGYEITSRGETSANLIKRKKETWIGCFAHSMVDIGNRQFNICIHPSRN